MSVMSKFRTPAWRPFRAGVFVSMGLSAVFPVLHGLRLYGASQMRDQIGLLWLVLQGALYILGAGIYAVQFEHIPNACPQSDVIGRLAYLKNGFLADMMYGVARIRFFTCW